MRLHGPSLAELPNPAVTREAYAARYSLDVAKHWITLMPGSRRKEVRMNLPTMLEAAAQLGAATNFFCRSLPRSIAAFWNRCLVRKQQVLRLRCAPLGMQCMQGTKSSERQIRRIRRSAGPALFCARVATGFVAFPGGHCCQRHGDRGSGDDVYAVRDGLPGLVAYLFAGPEPHQSPALRHGQSDCGREDRAGTGAARLYSGQHPARNCGRSFPRESRGNR